MSLECQFVDCDNRAVVLVIPKKPSKINTTKNMCDLHHTYTDENGATPFLTGCTFERLNN